MNNILSKDQFIDVMKGLARVDATTRKLNDFITENMEGYIYYPDATVEVLITLQTMFDDEEDWIGFFYSQMDIDGIYKPGFAKDNDGNDIPMKDAGDLWELLMKNLRLKYMTGAIDWVNMD